MKAYELLSSPEKWTKGVSVRDKNDNQVSIDDPDACKFCIYGAIRTCYGKEHDKLKKVMDKLKYSSTDELFKWNDSSTYEEVVSVLKELDI